MSVYGYPFEEEPAAPSRPATPASGLAETESLVGYRYMTEAGRMTVPTEPMRERETSTDRRDRR